MLKKNISILEKHQSPKTDAETKESEPTSDNNTIAKIEALDAEDKKIKNKIK